MAFVREAELIERDPVGSEPPATSSHPDDVSAHRSRRVNTDVEIALLRLQRLEPVAWWPERGTRGNGEERRGTTRAARLPAFVHRRCAVSAADTDATHCGRPRLGFSGPRSREGADRSGRRPARNRWTTVARRQRLGPFPLRPGSFPVAPSVRTGLLLGLKRLQVLRSASHAFLIHEVDPPTDHLSGIAPVRSTTGNGHATCLRTLPSKAECIRKQEAARRRT